MDSMTCLVHSFELCVNTFNTTLILYEINVVVQIVLVLYFYKLFHNLLSDWLTYRPMECVLLHYVPMNSQSAKFILCDVSYSADLS